VPVNQSGHCGGGIRKFTASSPPLIDCLPPDEPKPFVETNLGPLPMSPPSGPKLLIVACRRYCVRVCWKFPPENVDCPPRMKIRRDDEYAPCAQAS
jgi:hypothetical protein